MVKSGQEGGKIAKVQYKAKKAKVVKKAMHLHGFDLDMLRAYPHGISDGDFPVYFLRLTMDE